MDDTGNGLQIARADAAAGELAAAAERVRAALSERVQIYVRLSGDRVR